MTVSYENSKVIFQGLKAAGITSLYALPETWLGLLLQPAARAPDVALIQVGDHGPEKNCPRRNIFSI